jgi:hypothetical protein
MPVDSLERLRCFFASSPAARAATRPLSSEVEVAIELDRDRVARFAMGSGEPVVTPEPARDPDFTLVLPDRAVAHLTDLESEDVGEFGVAFFSLVLSRDPETKVRVRINAPTTRLLRRGYLGVLAIGGMKVSWWLLKNGVKNPKAAIDRIREVR